MAIQADKHPVVAIIQARMTSTRLPGKVLAEIGGIPALEFMLRRVRLARCIDTIVVATSVNTSDDPVAAVASTMDVPVFRGSELDVLGRFADAATQSRANTVVRLTADCPLIDPTIIDEVVEFFLRSNSDFDYVSNSVERTYPDGLDVEVFSRRSLALAAENASSSFCREHVTPYLHGAGAKDDHGCFRCGQVTFSADFSLVRWTVDFAEDLDRVRRLVSRLPEGFTWLQALAEAIKEPDLLGIPPRSF